MILSSSKHLKKTRAFPLAQNPSSKNWDFSSFLKLNAKSVEHIPKSIFDSVGNTGHQILSSLPRFNDFNWNATVFLDDEHNAYISPYLRSWTGGTVRETHSFIFGVEIHPQMLSDQAQMLEDIYLIAGQYLIDTLFSVIQYDKKIYFFLYPNLAFCSQEELQSYIDKASFSMRLIQFHLKLRFKHDEILELTQVPLSPSAFKMTLFEMSDVTNDLYIAPQKTKNIIFSREAHFLNWRQTFSLKKSLSSLSMGLQVSKVVESDKFLKQVIEFRDVSVWVSEAAQLEESLVFSRTTEKSKMTRLDAHSICAYLEVYYNLNLHVDDLSGLLLDIATKKSKPSPPMPPMSQEAMDFLGVYLTALEAFGGQGKESIFYYNNFKKFLEKMGFQGHQNDNVLAPVLKASFSTPQGIVSIDTKKDRAGGRVMLLDGIKQKNNPFFFN